MGLSGVQRIAKFIKYLPQYGWKPTVLTVQPRGYYAFDPSLLAEAEQGGAEIVRTNPLDATRLFRKQKVVKMPSEGMRKFMQLIGDTFLIPDTKIGWKRRAVKVGSGLLRSKHFDLIFATAPPQTDFLVGHALKKRFRVPLVLEYRDAWLEYPFKFYPTPLHRWAHYRLEKRVVKDSDRVIVTHRRIKEDLLRRYRFLGYHDVPIISQGYDPEDFGGHSTAKKRGTQRMRITHAGTFYGGRAPTTLIKTLHALFQQSPSLRGRIELCFVGNVRDEDRALVKKLGLQNEVVFTGYVEHRECTRLLQDSDVLWFVNDNDRSSPGKLYEYFGARKPILASVVDGYTKQLIEESQAAWIVPLRDAEAHRRVLAEMLSAFEKKKLKQVPQHFADRFNRAFLTGELVKQFESLMDIDRNAFRRMEVSGR